jgi:hypothetical protein
MGCFMVCLSQRLALASVLLLFANAFGEAHVQSAQSQSAQSPSEPPRAADKPAAPPVPGTVPSGQGDTQAAGPPTSTNAAPAAARQSNLPIEFESHGLEYEAITKNGITVMFAPLPPHIRDYNVVQVTVTNGSPIAWTVKTSDFSFVRQDGTVLSPVSPDEVVGSLLQKASRNDVIKLQLLYEDSIYALSNFRSTNGYEQRREAAMAQFVNRGFKAAAQASAITFVPAKLKTGDSTDGAVFFANRSKDKSLGTGRFIARTCGEIFEFEVFTETKTR